MKKKENRVNIRRRILFARWDKIVNMTAAEIRAFRNSKEAEGVSQTPEEARLTGAGVLSGIEASKKLEAIISKAAPYRHQYKNLPPWTDSQWELIGRQIRMISRARANVGDFIGDDGEPTIKCKALFLWGRDERKSKQFPNKDIVKKEVQEFTRKEKEAEKKSEKKLTESFFSNLLSI